MKKVLLFLFLINLSLFAQTYTEATNSLYYAIKANNPKAISNALRWGYSLNSIFFEVDEAGFGNHVEVMPVNLTPLFYAIYCGNIEAIDTLLKLGANLERLTDIYSPYVDITVLDDYTGSVNMTPLMYASYLGAEKVMSYLINKGAKVNAKNIDGKTALMYSWGDSTKFLINAGADVNAKDNEGKTALMYAYAAYNKVSVDLLIKNRANVNAKDNEGNTALLHAIYRYTGEGISLRIEYDSNGADGYTGPDGYTIEEYEDNFSPSFHELTKLLINNGANVNIKNKNGQTPLSLSKEFPKLTKLLRDNVF